MRIQKRHGVLERTKLSVGSRNSSLIDELDLKEIEAYENENYCEAFILQFSFLETKLESMIEHFARLGGVHASTLKQLKGTWKVSDKIGYFDCLVSPLVAPQSKNDLTRVIQMLREYNTFRNDYLHDCSNPKKFEGAVHLDYALEEAHSDGLEIMRLLSKIKLKKQLI